MRAWALASRAVRKIAWALLVVAGVTTLCFVVAYVVPGDPARMLAGAQASAEDVATVRRAYGLDLPIGPRFVRFAKRLVHFGSGGPKPRTEGHESCANLGALHVDLGSSPHHGKPVVDLLAAKAPRSVELAACALALQLLFGIGAGAFAASRRGTWIDQAVTSLTLLGVSVPTFVIGLLLQYVLAYRLGVLPYDGYGTSTAEHARSIVLPAFTLGVFGAALYARLVREELSAHLASDFARAARARGAGRARVLFAHALRAAAVPIATLAALDFGTLVGGAIVTERLFRWPGVGQMTVDALVNRDGPVIVGTVLFSATAVVLSMLALDVIATLLDPRQR